VQTFWLISSLLCFAACEAAETDEPTSGETAADSTATGNQDAAPLADSGTGPDLSVTAMDALVDAEAMGDVSPAVSDAAPNNDGSEDSARPEVDSNVVSPDAALDMAVVVPEDAGSGQDVGVQPADAMVDMLSPEPDMGPLQPDMAVGNGDYPDAPYGVAVGETIEDLQFVDWHDVAYSLSDMRDEPNVRLIALISVAAWCPTCARKMAPVGVLNNRLRPEGVLTVVSLFEDPNFGPAIARDAAIWRRDHGLELPIVADGPQALAPYFEPFGRNTYILIHAATMTIAHISHRLDGDELDRRIQEALGQ
jgi:hypothetical protein